MKLFGSDPTTPEGARKAVRVAGVAGFVSAGLTVALVLFVALSQTEMFGGMVSLWSLIDAGVMAALAFGTYRGNRFAAVGQLGLYVLNRVLIWVQAGEAAGLALAVVFVLLFVQGVVGAFTLHRSGDADPLTAQVDAIAEAERAGSEPNAAT